MEGDGAGRSEIRIGPQSGTSCINACKVRQRVDNRINGVTVFKDNRRGCWCELKMTGIHKGAGSVKYYKTCFLNKGKHLSVKCSSCTMAFYIVFYIMSNFG